MENTKKEKENKIMAKWVCTVCGYVHEGDTPPEKCPQCGEMLYQKKGRALLVCKKEGCGYKREITDSSDAKESGEEK